MIEAYLGAKYAAGNAGRRCIERRRPKLSVTSLQAGYGDVQVLWDVSLEVARRRAGLHHRLERRRQDHADALPVGAAAANRRQHRHRRQDRWRRRRRRISCSAGIAHVPEGRRLFSAMSVRDNLLMGAYLRTDKAGIAADLERVYAMFPILAERQRQDAGTLSGGEQQMCAIGRGLMAAPSLLLIDELSLGLAPRAVELLSESLRKVKQAGVAILLVEQDVMNALELADRAYVIDHGRVYEIGPRHGPRQRSRDPRSLYGIV